MSDGTDPAAPATPRRVKILLAVSLALNLAVAGLIAGAWWRMGEAGHGPGFAGARGAFALVGALDRDDRHEVLREMRGTWREARRDGQAATQTILALLKAETLDTAALRRAVAEQGARGHALQVRVQQLWLDRVTAMAPAERRAYVERLEDALSERRPRKDGRWH